MFYTFFFSDGSKVVGDRREKVPKQCASFKIGAHKDFYHSLRDFWVCVEGVGMLV